MLFNFQAELKDSNWLLNLFWMIALLSLMSQKARGRMWWSASSWLQREKKGNYSSYVIAKPPTPAFLRAKISKHCFPWNLKAKSTLILFFGEVEKKEEEKKTEDKRV